MTDYEAYTTYLALKLHFSTDYDFFRYNGKVSASPESFKKRKEKYQFVKLAKKLSDEQYKQLKDSISRFGLVDPIIVNKNKDRKGIIIGGHQRVKVAKTMGIEKVPCVEIDLTYDKERELNVRLNKNTGSWDFDVLANTFDIDELLDWGFDEKELQLDVFDEEKEKYIIYNFLACV